MLFKFFTYDEFSDFMYDFNSYEWTLKSDENESFEGFHYFSPMNFQVGFYKEKCLVAFNEKEDPHDIVGLIWFGEYGPSGLPTHQAVSFIDVRKDCRRRGIATALIKKFDSYIDRSRPMYISQLSDEGKLCHIGELFKNNLHTDVIVGY